MNTSRDGHDPTADLLARALAEEADRVETDPGALQAIQARTRASRRSSFARNRWALAVGGAGLVTAATITGVVLIGDSSSPKAPIAGPERTQGTVSDLSGPATGEGGQSTVVLHYLGVPGPTGDRYLHTEPHQVETSGRAPSLAAVHEFLTSRPFDPDYTSGWPSGVDIEGMSVAQGVTTVDLVGEANLESAHGLSPQAARAAIQGMVRTAGITDGAMSVTYNGERLDTLLGVDVSTPVVRVPDQAAEASNLLRAPIEVETPVEGASVTSTVEVTGSGNVSEGTVNWELVGADQKAVDDGYVTTAFLEWKDFTVRLRDLPPGEYTFRAFSVSMEDGSEQFVDDTTFTVQ